MRGWLLLGAAVVPVFASGAWASGVTLDRADFPFPDPSAAEASVICLALAMAGLFRLGARP